MFVTAGEGCLKYSKQTIRDYSRQLRREQCRDAARFILERNIIWGDALTLKTVGEKAEPHRLFGMVAGQREHAQEEGLRV